MNSFDSDSSFDFYDSTIIYDTTCMVKKVLENIIGGECDVLGSFEYKLPEEPPLEVPPSVWAMTDAERKILEARSIAKKPTLVKKAVQPPTIVRNNQPVGNFRQEAQLNTGVLQMVQPTETTRTYANVCAQGTHHSYYEASRRIVAPPIQQRLVQPAPPAIIPLQNEAELEAKMMSLAWQIAQAVNLSENSTKVVPSAPSNPIQPANTCNMIVRQRPVPPRHLKQKTKLFSGRPSHGRSIFSRFAKNKIPPPPGFGPHYNVSVQPRLSFRSYNI